MSNPYLFPGALDPKPVGGDEPDTASFVELLGAGLKRESLPARLLHEWTYHKNFPVDPDYDPLQDSRLKDIGTDILAFAHSTSPEETSWLLAKRAKDREAKDMLEESGLKGAVAAMIGATLNPSIGVPAIAWAGKAFRSGLATGTAQGLSTLAEQSMLSALDSTRTPEEVALGALFSGAVGIGIGKLASLHLDAAARWKAAMDRFEGVDPPRGTAAAAAPDVPPDVPPRGPAPLGAADEPLGPIEIDPDTGVVSAARAQNPEDVLRPNEAALEAKRREWVDRLQRGDAGAAQAPGAQPRTDAEIFDDLYPKAAYGLERLSVNPMMGLLNSGLRESRELVEQLVEIPFFLRQDAKGIARQTSIESAMRQHRKPLADALRHATDQWLTMRTGAGGDTLDQLKVQAGDLIGRTRGMSYASFMEEVGKAMRRGDQAAIPEVAATARAFRSVIDRLARDAADVGAFEAVQSKRRAVLRLRDRLGDKADLPAPADPLTAGWTADEVALRQQLDEVMKELRQVEGKIPEVTTAESFLPRVWRHDRILARRAELEGIIAAWMKRTSPHLADAEAKARETVEKLLHDRPFQHMDDPDVTGAAMSLHGRTLEIPDELVEDFLESNAEAVLMHHVRTMAADIEIVRHQNARWDFGLISMQQDRQLISDAWMQRINAFKASGDTAAAAEARQQMKADLERVAGLRDRLRGAVGLTQDPWSLSSRAIRLAKQTASVLYMGGAALSATVDLAKPVMTEGLARTLESGYRPLFRETRALVMHMAREEAQLAGTAFSHELGIRGAMLLDTGDTFGRYSAPEGVMSKLADLTFVANGLNWVDQSTRTVASMIVGTRIIKDAEAWARGTLKPAGVEKLARAGIDRPMAERIAQMTSMHAENVDGVWLPNTAKWQDADAAAAFRRALGEDIDRTIALKGAGDTPLFMSQPVGSLLMLFRSFGFSALMRTTMPALQQADRSAFMGMALMTAMGGVVNEIRDHLNGREQPRDFVERLGRAVDRSGVAGIAADVVNAADRVASRGLPGMVETGGGPAASMGLDGAKVLVDLANRTMTPQGARAARRLLPWNTMVWADSLFDAIEHGMRSH